METVLYLEAKTKGQRQSWYFMMMLHYVTAVKIVLPIEVSTINSTELLLYLQINYILQRTTEKEDFNFPSQSNVTMPVFNDYLSDASVLNPSQDLLLHNFQIKFLNDSVFPLMLFKAIGVKTQETRCFNRSEHFFPISLHYIWMDRGGSFSVAYIKLHQHLASTNQYNPGHPEDICTDHLNRC